jgi:hypothetical protein
MQEVKRALLRRKGTGRSSKKMPIIIVGIVLLLVLILASILYISINSRDTSKIYNLNNAAPLKNNNVQLAVDLEPIESSKTAEELSGGDKVRLSFSLKNTSNNGEGELSLSSGLEKSKVNDIRIIKGSTGFVEENGMVVFKNVSVAPNQTQTVVIEATLNFTLSDTELFVQPILLRQDSTELASLGKKSFKIAKNSTDEIQSTVTVEEN